MVFVNFQADVVSGLDAHDGELQVLTSPQGGAVVGVFHRRIFDVDDVRVGSHVLAHCALLLTDHLRPVMTALPFKDRGTPIGMQWQREMKVRIP